jgi:hypothetical protein
VTEKSIYLEGEVRGRVIIDLETNHHIGQPRQ